LGFSGDTAMSENDVLLGVALEHSLPYGNFGSKWMMSLDGNIEIGIYGGPSYTFQLRKMNIGLHANALLGVGTQNYHSLQENVDNGDLAETSLQQAFFQPGVNVGLDFEWSNISLSTEISYKRNIEVDKVESQTETQWVCLEETKAPLDNLYMGLALAYRFSNEALRDGGNLWNITAGCLWDKDFGFAAEIESGWTWMFSYGTVVTASAGIDYYWQSHSVSAYIKGGPEFWPWGNDSFLGFGVKPKLALGSFYGYNYDVVLPEDPDRFQSGRFSNYTGLKFNTELSGKIRFGRCILTLSYAPGLFWSPKTIISDNLSSIDNSGVRYNGEVAASLEVNI
jgi:hypothetical protein